MIGKEAPEICWATHKRQVINLWNCYILLVNLFESYDDARTCEHQINEDLSEIIRLSKADVLLKSYFFGQWCHAVGRLIGLTVFHRKKR